MVEILSKFDYPLMWSIKRNPIRPIDLRVINFEKLYDYNTVWNDCVQVNQSTIMLIGPPLYDTANYLQQYCKITDAVGNKLRCRTVEMDRACVVYVTVNSFLDNIVIHNQQYQRTIKVNQLDYAFDNKKVIVTISKNHPISWLQQWIDYHKIVHNVEGLLLYNNQSTIYSSIELEDQLKRDDMIIKIVDYDVPFGVMGGGDWEWEGRSGTYLPWDSDFSQYVMLEHAKQRYLHCAKLAINADTDELLLINNATLDQVAEYCQVGEYSALLYKGIWIEPVNSITTEIANNISFDDRNFKNYWHTSYSNQRGIGIKWLLYPKKNMQYQWHLHKTFGPHTTTEEIGFAHYLAMNTSWSWSRDTFNGNTNNLVELTLLKNCLNTWNQIRLDTHATKRDSHI
jgi:hypothetical protein